MQQYGDIDSDLFGKVGTFVTDESVDYIFTAEGANIALDTVHIESSSRRRRNRMMLSDVNWNSIMFAVMDGTTLIVDSTIQEVEFGVIDSCAMICGVS